MAVRGRLFLLNLKMCLTFMHAHIYALASVLWLRAGELSVHPHSAASRTTPFSLSISLLRSDSVTASSFAVHCAFSVEHRRRHLLPALAASPCDGSGLEQAQLFALGGYLRLAWLGEMRAVGEKHA